MSKKQYDPLWELVGEKFVLQGIEEDVDALCPNCHVKLHLGREAQIGQAAECGLCGAALQVVSGETALTLRIST